MAPYEIKLGKAQAARTGRRRPARTVGPPLFEALEVMGRDESLSATRRRHSPDLS